MWKVVALVTFLAGGSAEQQVGTITFSSLAECAAFFNGSGGKTMLAVRAPGVIKKMKVSGGPISGLTLRCGR